jgi:hypothetical protein
MLNFYKGLCQATRPSNLTPYSNESGTVFLGFLKGNKHSVRGLDFPVADDGGLSIAVPISQRLRLRKTEGVISDRWSSNPLLHSHS